MRHADSTGAPLLLSGDAERIVDELHAEVERVGATCLNVRVHVPGEPVEALLEQIERLASDVLPALR